MKYVIASALLGLAATSALAEPLLVKSNHSGFTAPDWVRTESCQLFLDKVVIQKRYGSIVTTETRPLTVSPGITAAITKAAGEELKETPNLLCDGPGTSIQANLPSSSDPVVLFNTGGCGTPSQDREGPASSQLKELIDTYCPTTHRAGLGQ